MGNTLNLWESTSPGNLLVHIGHHASQPSLPTPMPTAPCKRSTARTWRTSTACNRHVRSHLCEMAVVTPEAALGPNTTFTLPWVAPCWNNDCEQPACGWKTGNTNAHVVCVCVCSCILFWWCPCLPSTLHAIIHCMQWTVMGKGTHKNWTMPPDGGLSMVGGAYCSGCAGCSISCLNICVSKYQRFLHVQGNHLSTKPTQHLASLNA
eukprot:1146135-Pelagomonas_calceolata.AAC.23